MATYLWSNQATSNPASVFSAGLYTVTVTNSSNGCTATASTSVAACAALTVATTGNTSFCLGSGVSNCTSLTAAATGNTAGTTLSYAWSNLMTTATVQVCPTATTTYTVTATASNGATGTKSVTVTVNTPPFINISGNTPICAGSTTTLTASAGMSAYLWNTNQTTPSIVVTAAGLYVVTVSTANGCTASSSKTVIVNPSPIVSILQLTSGCLGVPVRITASGGGSYLWNNTATSPSISAPAGSTYTVTVTNSAGCSKTASIQTIAISSPNCGTIARLGAKQTTELTVSPNPGTETCLLTIPNETDEFAFISIFDINGRLITTYSQSLRESNQVTIETASWSAGMYLFQIKTASTIETIKWAKE
jgi:hypothetical protein